MLLAKVEVAQRGWVETGPLDTEVGFDKNRDVKGPVTVAGALERDVDGKAQRVVIVGSGRFLANTDAGLLGNLDLGVNLVNKVNIVRANQLYAALLGQTNNVFVHLFLDDVCLVVGALDSGLM